MSASLHDFEAERSVLAAILLDNGCLVRVGELAPADFYQPAHSLVFDAMLSLWKKGVPVDAITLVDELRRRERLNTVGGPQYIHELTDTMPTLAYVEHHARIVVDRAEHRRAYDGLRRAGERMAQGEPRAAVWSELSSLMATDSTRSQGAAPVGTDLDDLHTVSMSRAEGKESSLATPWPSFNALLGSNGLWPGMYVLVGSTGSGKSQWAVQLAVQAAQAGTRTLYLALELSRRDLAARVMGLVANVPWSHLLRGTLPLHRMESVFDPRHLRRVKELPLYTECGVPFGYGVDTLLSRAWSLRPRLIVLDYLQLCGSREGEEPRVSVGRVSYAARALARDLNAVVLVLSSTARTNYAELVSDPDRDPTEFVGLGKESGEIEYAADGVLVMARDARSHDETRRMLVLAKHRYGPVGRVALSWNGTQFSDETASSQTQESSDTADGNGLMI